MIDVNFLNYLVKKYQTPEAKICITDSSTRVLAATEEHLIGIHDQTAGYILRIQQPATITQSTSASSSNQFVTCGIPIHRGSEFWGTVIVMAPAALSSQLCRTLQVALESALVFDSYRSKKDTDPKDELNRIAAMMVSEHIDFDSLIPLMHQHELEPNLSRTVIYIRLEYHENSYFNINLNLGYQSSIEKLRQEVADRIQHSRYLNSQDLIYLPDRNTILVIKSFQPSEDLSRVYLALDVICKDLEKLLSRFSFFSFFISYGNLYPKIEMLSKSRKEAELTLLTGKELGKPGPFYILEDLLFESICRSLQPQVVNKLLEPSLQKLYRHDGTLPDELIDCCESFVDHCMSFSRTSTAIQQHRNTISTRLKKLQALTGLDPTSNFQDAFLVKMLAIYSKQKKNLPQWRDRQDEDNHPEEQER